MSMKKRRRVVITGMGALTPLGNNVEEYWNGLLEGRSVAKITTKFDSTDFASKIACELENFNIDDYLDPKQSKRMDKFTQYAYVAGMEALTNAGLVKDGQVVESLDKTKIGVLIGSGIGGIETIIRNVRIFDEKGPKKVSPFMIPMMITDMASGQCSMLWGFKGPNFSISSACATGNHSITSAYHIIERGDAEIMVTGGSENSLVDIGIAGFSIARALSKRNDDPKTASRPFDIDRDGFVPAEGAGIVILESEENALKRGAKIYAELLGTGMSADAFHITEPCEDGSGAILSMENSIRDADIKKEEISYINTHGTSTPKGDKAEVSAIKKVFGEHSKNLKINSTKSMTGHLLGAAGGIEAIAVVKTIQTGKIHPTINVFNQDPDCDLDVVPNKAIEKEVNIGMSNSFGFGGHNCTLIIGKYNNK